MTDLSVFAEGVDFGETFGAQYRAFDIAAYAANNRVARIVEGSEITDEIVTGRSEGIIYTTHVKCPAGG